MIYAEEAERSVLGSIIIFPELITAHATIGSVKQILPGETMFYHPAHRTIYKAIMDLFSKSYPVDMVTVTHWLTQRNELQNIGGDDYLIQICEDTPLPWNVPYYAQIVRDAWMQRVILGRCEKIITDHAAGNLDADSMFKAATELGRGNLMRGQFAFPIGEESEAEGVLEGLETGFHGLDSQTSMYGLPKGQLSVIGAYTGWGKSTLCQQITRNVAERGERTAYCCFGADLNRLSLRARWCKQATSHMPVKNLPAQFWDEVTAEMGVIKQLPIMVYEAEKAPDRTIETCIEWLEMEHRANPFSLVVFDYAQIMRTQRKVFGYKETMEVIAQECNAAAAKLGVATILASQVQDEESLDFRYSQEFKHAAGFAVVVQRDGPEVQGGWIDIKPTVVKNRWGYEGAMEPCRWVPRFTRFENL